ncbi:MAG TPA: hypothetical protein VJN70_02750 [Gemmatimonadaceae bacterium]|nr:hypothetical protein [Gemmatimonadaceae bacterium]
MNVRALLCGMPMVGRYVSYEGKLSAFVTDARQGTRYVLAMAYREFQDSAGVSWTVWDTHPSRPDAINPDLRLGWLTFQSERTRRRLAPIPPGWSDASASRLELLCKAAEPSRRETPANGIDESSIAEQ